MTENDISYKIRGAIFKVYNALGPGLLESAYENALAYELRGSGIGCKGASSLTFRVQWNEDGCRVQA